MTTKTVRSRKKSVTVESLLEKTNQLVTDLNQLYATDKKPELYDSIIVLENLTRYLKNVCKR